MIRFSASSGIGYGLSWNVILVPSVEPVIVPNVILLYCYFVLVPQVLPSPAHIIAFMGIKYQRNFDL